MSDPHHPHPHPHPHSDEDHAGDRATDIPGSPAPRESFEDAGSQALADALRSSFAVVKVLMGVLVAVFLLSGFFKIGRAHV